MIRTIRALLIPALPALLLACERSPAEVTSGAMTAVQPLVQETVVASRVPFAPAVRVTTTDGNPAAGVEVRFTMSGAGSSLLFTTRRTSPDGTASSGEWHVGERAGDYYVAASIQGMDDQVVFRATARAAPAAALEIVKEPAAVAVAGVPLAAQPQVRVVDAYGNAVADANVTITASAPGVTIAGDVAETDSGGVATFTALALAGNTGSYALRFESVGLGSVHAAEAVHVVAGDPCSANASLPTEVGTLVRYEIAAHGSPLCLPWEPGQHAGREFLVLLEHMPALGSYTSAIFPGTDTDAPPLSYAVHAAPAGTALVTPSLASVTAPVGGQPVHGWDFGDGILLEGEPVMLPSSHAMPTLLRAGDAVPLLQADPVPGDTIQVRMEGIPRLGINAGNQRAVIRHVSKYLIIAEDVRLATTLLRDNGRRNTPLSANDLEAIAAAYEQAARIQGDLLFDGRHNNAVEQARNGRVLAVHSLTNASNVWGYTYPTGDYFIWDFWAGTDGSTRGHNQHPQRVADNLFMHEIAHLRHMGMLQRSGLPPRGNRWLVEGFARFTERLPIAARLTGTHEFSRTGNILLPRDPAFNNSYFRDDVPTYLNAGTPFTDGYHHSAWLFDYIADHVAASGRDWRLALREFVVAAGAPHTLDETVARWFPGVTANELITRARLALYLDDLSGYELPAWTQYLQYRLRESRPAGAAAPDDPRTAWPALPAGSRAEVAGSLRPGAARGIVINGASAAVPTRYAVFLPGAGTASLSIVRIR